MCIQTRQGCQVNMKLQQLQYIQNNTNNSNTNENIDTNKLNTMIKQRDSTNK